MSNRLDRQAMLAGQVQLGFVLTYPAPGILEAVHRDWDWFWIDGQHGQLDRDMILQCVRAADVVGTPAVIRVPDHSPGFICAALDMDSAGIIVPMVNTAEQARCVVDAAKFPPLGQRSYGGRRVYDIGGPDYWAQANDESLLIVQIETEQAAENVEEIVAVPGVDAVFFGADDLRRSLELPTDMPITEPAIAERMQRVAAAACTAGKIAGAVGGTKEAASFLAQMGYTLLAGAGEAGLIRSKSASLATELRESLRQIQ